MLEIVCLGLNKEQRVQRKALQSLISIGGYLFSVVLIGIYLDQKFFHNGISVIVMFLLGIMSSFIHILRLVMTSNDYKEN
jgi:F0F1-type ATP synthase assembly protein I